MEGKTTPVASEVWPSNPPSLRRRATDSKYPRTPSTDSEFSVISAPTPDHIDTTTTTTTATTSINKQRWKTGISPTWGKPLSASSERPSPTTESPAAQLQEDLHQRDPLRPTVLPQSQDTTATALATPFLPGISGGIWSPPSWATPPPAPERKEEDKDAQIRFLQERIQHLAMEKDHALHDNVRLSNEVEHLSALVSEVVHSPPHSSTPLPLPSPHLRNFGTLPFSHSVPPLNNVPFHPVGSNLPDPRLNLEPLQLQSTTDEFGVYRPSQITIDLILSGQLDYMRMDPRSEYDIIRPLVWTIAHQEPRSNSQAATLKIAANALGGRLGQPPLLPITQYLLTVILEWAKPLCYTSNGNYLCQQLLEKGTTEDKINFIKVIYSDLVSIANNKFGAHVLVKAVSVKELEPLISDALFQYGVFESMQTGARKIWRPYLGKCRDANNKDIFQKIMTNMTGRWSDLAVANENGSISVQQVFEGCANEELMDACFKEILEDISRVANNQFGHFVINKLLNFQEPLVKGVSHAILTAYPPLATNHHGVQFVEFVLSSSRLLQRTNIVKYLESLCSQQNGRTAAIVTVANSSVGRGHLQSVLRQVPPSERVLMGRIHSTCRQYQTTLRNSQSGNELLRSLGIINTPARRG